jgi:hypothetical protein
MQITCFMVFNVLLVPADRAVLDTNTTMTDNTTFPESVMATMDNVLFEP